MNPSQNLTLTPDNVASLERYAELADVTPTEFLNRVYARHLTEVVRRFVAALQRALPDLPSKELFWRLHFGVGMMVHILNWASILPVVTNGMVDVADSQQTTDRVVAFASAGFRAPVVHVEKQ